MVEDLKRQLATVTQIAAEMSLKIVQYESEILGKPLPDLPNSSATTPLAKAKRVYRARRRRSIDFENLTDHFHEPVWDVLLDLFIAAESGQRVPVSAACIGAAVPNTTALRALRVLEERGIIRFQNDPADARRKHVHLEEPSLAKMRTFFAGPEFSVSLR